MSGIRNIIFLAGATRNQEFALNQKCHGLFLQFSRKQFADCMLATIFAEEPCTRRSRDAQLRGQLTIIFAEVPCTYRSRAAKLIRANLKSSCMQNK